MGDIAWIFAKSKDKIQVDLWYTNCDKPLKLTTYPAVCDRGRILRRVRTRSACAYCMCRLFLLSNLHCPLITLNANPLQLNYM